MAGFLQSMALRALKKELPSMEAWIVGYVDEHRERRQPVADAGFVRLPQYFTEARLQTSYFAIVDRIKLPPVHGVGLPDLSTLMPENLAGITYLDTYFLLPAYRGYEALHFHELIHTIQWAELGVQPFLYHYARGLLGAGYRKSPLESVAYGLQRRFEACEVIEDLEADVRAHAHTLAAEGN
ncbi:MAG: hypothetical protein ACFB21_12340 [Opitutales bacterium]